MKEIKYLGEKCIYCNASNIKLSAEGFAEERGYLYCYCKLNFLNNIRIYSEPRNCYIIASRVINFITFQPWGKI